ncbi:MAG TPA: hypothetical protein VKV15_04100 [Bryobacteraceae bacterium]|nr:hypothetical protein [Bryobacteraceae bacterium]
MTLHASTIATVSARAFYSTPAISWNIPCSQTSQTDPASASCVLNSSAYPQADYNASATVADGDVTVNVLGGTSVRAAAEANVLASFIDSFTFIPGNGQNAPTQVQYALLYGGSSTSDVPMGILETFNGAQILQGGGGESFVDHGLTSITQPYSGGIFESAGQITATSNSTAATRDLPLRNCRFGVSQCWMLRAKLSRVRWSLRRNRHYGS